MVGRPLAQNPERGVREEKKARHFNMEPVGHTHCLLFLGHVNVKSGFLDCSCLIDVVWKGLPRCQVKVSWIGCWQLSASSSIYDFPRSLRWTGAMLISWFFVLRCYVKPARRIWIHTMLFASSRDGSCPAKRARFEQTFFLSILFGFLVPCRADHCGEFVWVVLFFVGCLRLDFVSAETMANPAGSVEIIYKSVRFERLWLTSITTKCVLKRNCLLQLAQNTLEHH